MIELLSFLIPQHPKSIFQLPEVYQKQLFLLFYCMGMDQNFVGIIIQSVIPNDNEESVSTNGGIQILHIFKMTRG